MRTLALLALALLGCHKEPAKEAAKPAQPKVEQGPMAAAFDPANLPPPGTAPAPVAAGDQITPMWTAPIKTLKGQPTTRASRTSVRMPGTYRDPLS